MKCQGCIVRGTVIRPALVVDVGRARSRRRHLLVERCVGCDPCPTCNRASPRPKLPQWAAAVVGPMIKHAIRGLVISGAGRPSVFQAFARANLEKIQAGRRLGVPTFGKEREIFPPSASSDVGEETRGDGGEIVKAFGGSCSTCPVGDKISTPPGERLAR